MAVHCAVWTSSNHACSDCLVFPVLLLLFWQSVNFRLSVGDATTLLVIPFEQARDKVDQEKLSARKVRNASY